MQIIFTNHGAYVYHGTGVHVGFSLNQMLEGGMIDEQLSSGAKDTFLVDKTAVVLEDKKTSGFIRKWQNSFIF